MKKALIAATLAFFTGASHAATHALTFDETNICTINIHVGYSQPDQLDTRTHSGDGPGSHARIELQALGGPLTLTHLDIGELDANQLRIRIERGFPHRPLSRARQR